LLGDTPFVFTGPDRWNSLGLGTTAVFAAPLVYNTKRTGTFELGGRSFVLRRVAFPPDPPPEWYIVDLLEHADQAGATRAGLAKALAGALARNRFDALVLAEMARRYGSKATQNLVRVAAGVLEPPRAKEEERLGVSFTIEDLDAA
jgi:hypothetical protein